MRALIVTTLGILMGVSAHGGSRADQWERVSTDSWERFLPNNPERVRKFIVVARASRVNAPGSGSIWITAVLDCLHKPWMVYTINWRHEGAVDWKRPPQVNGSDCDGKEIVKPLSPEIGRLLGEIPAEALRMADPGSAKQPVPQRKKPREGILQEYGKLYV